MGYFAAFGKESRRNGPPLISVPVQCIAVHFPRKIMGFIFGGVLGFILALIFQRYARSIVAVCLRRRVANHSILAMAPMVIIWLKPAGFPSP